MQKRVSHHAKQRCHERFGISNKIIKDIMIYGNPPAYYGGEFGEYLISIQNARSGAVIPKVKNEIIVVYNKRSQRAITIYGVPEKFRPSDEYLLKAFKNRRCNNGDNRSTEKSK